MQIVEHAAGIVEFMDAVEIDQDELDAWMLLRQECEPSDYTLNEDGNYVNRGGYTFTPEQIGISPVRYLNLTPDGEDLTFHNKIRDAAYDCLVKYVEIYPSVWRSIWWRVDGQIACYTNGQGMGSHSDREIEYTPGQVPESEAPIYNEISSTLILRKADTGGELKFATSNSKFNPDPGTLIMYPSNFIGAHAVEPVGEGERISYIEFFGQGTPIGGQGTGQEWFSELINPDGRAL